jgi:hypothetical protein
MKREKYIVAGILILFMASIVLAGDIKKEISADEAMKYYCITWINPDYNDKPNFTAKKTMNKDGTIEWYLNETSEAPSPYHSDATFKIEKSWIDKDGNVWLNMIYDWFIHIKYTVAKISDNGNTLEQDYSFDSYPTEIDPRVSSSYFIMYKK